MTLGRLPLARRPKRYFCVVSSPGPILNRALVDGQEMSMLSKPSPAFLWIGLFLCIGALTPMLDAQQLTGAIVGTVVDSSGAVVVGVTVSAVNTATNLTVTAETSKEGTYQIPNLP